MALFSVWAIAMWVYFPIPLVTMFLLTLPLPGSISHAICRATNKFLAADIMGITLYATLLLVAVLLFVATAIDAVQRGDYTKHLTKQADYQLHLEAHGKKWRSERNFWLSSSAFVIWMVYKQFVGMKLQLLTAEAEVAENAKKAESSKKKD